MLHFSIPHIPAPFSPNAALQNFFKYFSFFFFSLLHVSSVPSGCVGATLREEIGGKFWVQRLAVANPPSIPEFFPNSLIIPAFHDEHLIHFILK